MTAEQHGEERQTAERVEAEEPDETSEDSPADRSADQVGDADGPTDEYDAHLGEVPDGSGCTEIWEHLSEEREDGARATHGSEDDD